jgi:uncharacterized protein (UPF0335 family)
MDTELNTAARNELGDFVQRIESLTAEKAEVSERIKKEYAEAAGAGFDKKAIRQLIKERMADLDKTVQHRRTVEVYRRALGTLAGTPLGDWARSWIATDARQDRHENEPSAMAEFLSKRKGKGQKPSSPPPQ